MASRPVGNGNIYVYYNSGIPTAQSGYGGSNGSIGVGGTFPNVRVLLHESSHWLGTGTYSANNEFHAAQNQAAITFNQSGIPTGGSNDTGTNQVLSVTIGASTAV